MIISPAIIFIVAVSDIMHLINNQDLNFKTGEEVFVSQMRKIGVPIAITSITTMISFFTFILVDMVPLARFGLITGLGVIITLFISVIAYAIAVEYKFNVTNDNTFSQKIIDKIISLFTSQVQSLFVFNVHVNPLGIVCGKQHKN